MNNTKYLQKMKFYALPGFIGGIIFMIVSTAQGRNLRTEGRNRKRDTKEAEASSASLKSEQTNRSLLHLYAGV